MRRRRRAGFWTTFWLINSAPTVHRRMWKLAFISLLVVCTMAVCGHSR